MVTGHIQRLTNLAFESFMLKNELSTTSRASTKSSIYVILFFISGVAGGTVIASATNYHKNANFPIFSILGFAYALLLILHDRHVAQLRAQRAPKLIRNFSRRLLGVFTPTPNDSTDDLASFPHNTTDPKRSDSTSSYFFRISSPHNHQHFFAPNRIVSTTSQDQQQNNYEATSNQVSHNSLASDQHIIPEYKQYPPHGTAETTVSIVLSSSSPSSSLSRREDQGTTITVNDEEAPLVF
uniref:Uncharacterized protein n=1 Tax=Aureoumbra lagunensis TaxID=44058 RepID=A0A7S3NJ47_9STRA|mmetsp:Transcript_9400/g.14471  ORF Transcript_9400/g.14471 Transcript_9400/m.14471 type:complete len:239 (-) Transcript_9400:504-1220(-)